MTATQTATPSQTAAWQLDPAHSHVGGLATDNRRWDSPP